MEAAEFEWRCELAETEIKGLIREYPDKAAQARERPELIGWFVSRAIKNLDSKSSDSLDFMERLANEIFARLV